MEKLELRLKIVIKGCIHNMRKQKILTLLPVGGLCNRMRAIVAARNLANETEHDTEVLWFKNEDLGARYADLFEPSNSYRVHELDGFSNKATIKILNASRAGHPNRVLAALHSARYDCIWRDLGSNQLNDEDVQRGKNYRRIFISSGTPFYKSTLRNYDDFIPVAPIRREIDNFSQKFARQTYGVHVRRTDNVEAISNSPVDSFVDAIRFRLETEPEALFFLSTDSIEVRKTLIERFAPKIMFRESELTRGTSSGMSDALIDLFLLSRCAAIYGSFHSSFSHTAAHIGDIAEFTVRKKSEDI